MKAIGFLFVMVLITIISLILDNLFGSLVGLIVFVLLTCVFACALIIGQSYRHTALLEDMEADAYDKAISDADFKNKYFDYFRENPADINTAFNRLFKSNRKEFLELLRELEAEIRQTLKV